MRSYSRRDFLRLAGGLTVLSVLPFPEPAAGGLFDRLFSPPAQLTPAITPNDEFYVTSYRSPPTVRTGSWELSIKGLVDKPLTLTYSHLLARPAVSEIVTLECVGNPVAGEFISTASWEGVPLKALLEEVGVASNAYDVVFRAADDYSDSIRVERAMAGDVLVAHTMNGVPLPQGHGFPARIIVPGIYGMKSVQWLTEIEVVDRDYRGYYQKKGWSDDAAVKTMSRIDLPGHGATLRQRDYIVRGLAFAGTRGIRQVEVSTDGGGSWKPGTLEPALSPFAWVFWSYEWTIPSPGRHTLVVRATDGTGQLQSSAEQDPAPDGATGLHEITVTVGA
ncbi:MAG: molybdopterin-dependent oxidoreductase [Nitrospiraceae bacterium]